MIIIQCNSTIRITMRSMARLIWIDMIVIIIICNNTIMQYYDKTNNQWHAKNSKQ